MSVLDSPLVIRLMLRSQGIKAHWVQLKQDVESLFQGRGIQMRLARIVILRTAATDHESASDNPR